MSIDYKRFNSDSMLQNYMDERDAIRKYDKEAVITTNLMGTYKELDYFKWAKEMDIVSWDNYPDGTKKKNMLQLLMWQCSMTDAQYQESTVPSDGILPVCNELETDQ